MNKFFHDFKAFINKGNVIDMAVGVVVGGAFGKITTSLVNDIIMPLIGKLIGGLDVTEWKWVLTEAVAETETTPAVAEVAVRYGNFIQLIIDFLIIAFSVFVVIKLISKAREKAEAKKKAEEAAAAAAEAAKEPEPTKEELLLTEIRDLLKEKK